LTKIYHITHIDNLSGILREGGLWCDAERLRRGLLVQTIAYQELKDRRSQLSVETLDGRPVAAGGELADYVPFYFANRSPMLYAIHTGYVEGYTGGQAEVVYLVSSVERAVEMGTQWCFTDGHAVEALTEFFVSLDDLSRVDWTVVEHWSWHNRANNLDRKRRKQAEFLVHRFFPWDAVESIAVMTSAMTERVNNVISDSAPQTPVKVERSWYY
jgi:hypothetical protein